MVRNLKEILFKLKEIQCIYKELRLLIDRIAKMTYSSIYKKFD